MTVTIPTIETERLVLRPWAATDHEPYADMLADERVMRWLGGTKSRDEAWRHMAMMIGHWQLRGYGTWAIEETATGRFVGRAGPWYTPIFPEPEIGWTLCFDVHGRGFATEAARHARAYAYDRQGWTTAVSLVAPDNRASARVAEKLGCRPERRIPFKGVEVDVWRHPGRASAP